MKEQEKKEGSSQIRKKLENKTSKTFQNYFQNKISKIKQKSSKVNEE